MGSMGSEFWCAGEYLRREFVFMSSIAEFVSFNSTRVCVPAWQSFPKMLRVMRGDGEGGLYSHQVPNTEPDPYTIDISMRQRLGLESSRW